MRSFAFVDHLKFAIDGNISKDSITLADCDNDSRNELVLATLEGDLAVFKCSQTTVWAQSEKLGMVICVIVGDILNINKNCIVCVSVEGFCNIFNLSTDITIGSTNLSAKPSTIADSDQNNAPKTLTPFYTQRLPANAKIACLADIDNDGQNEFIVGLTDRVVRTYRCVHINDKIKLIGIHKWEFIDQIATLSLNPSYNFCDEETDGKKVYNILVAQPGGTYAKLECWDNRLVLNEDNSLDTSETISKLTPEYYELSIAQMRNPNISTEIIGGVVGKTRSGHKSNNLIALATLDGTLMLVDGRDILWSLQVDHQLFALSKLNITSDENEEIIACSWDGLTYIVNQDKHSLRFKFEEPVSAFIAGEYCLKPSEPNVKCLVYSTFNNSIYLYYNIEIDKIKSSHFKESLQKSSDLIEDMKKLMTSIGLPNEDMDSIKSDCSQVLYGLPQLSH